MKPDRSDVYKQGSNRRNQQISRITRFKKRVFEIIEKGAPGDTASKIFDSLLVGLILLNTAAIILASVQTLHAQLSSVFAVFEVYKIISVHAMEIGRNICKSSKIMCLISHCVTSI